MGRPPPGQVSGSVYEPYLGEYEDLDHGFIISPIASSSSGSGNASVPEPSSMLLFAGTAAAIVGFRRKMEYLVDILGFDRKASSAFRVDGAFFV